MMHVDIWPRIQKCAGIPIRDIPYAVSVLNDNRIYQTFADYIPHVDEAVAIEMLKLSASPITLFYYDDDHLWIFVGLLYSVCQAFYMIFNPEDELAMYPYNVMIPVGDNKDAEIQIKKAEYELKSRLYSNSHAVLVENHSVLWKRLSEEEIKHKDDLDWMTHKKPQLLKKWSITHRILEVLTVAAEIYNVEYKAFLEHPDVQSSL